MSPLARLKDAFVQNPVTRREVLRLVAFWMSVGLTYQILTTVNMAAWGQPYLGPFVIVALASQKLALVPASLVVSRAARLWVSRPEAGGLASTGAVVLGLLIASYASWYISWAVLTFALLDAWIPSLGIQSPRMLDARGHMSSLLVAFWPFLVMAVYYTAVAYRERMQEQERAAAALETELARAQVTALRMQLNPHFLFNALNVVSGLIEERPRQARTALAQLSDLLRGALKGADADATLADEVDWLRRYLDLQRLRFEDRLSVDLEIETDVLDARVPGFLLQPLVENAFEHGVARIARRGHVVILGRREGERLVLDVLDNGPGLGGGDEAAGGLGVTTTRERLNRLYGADATFDLADRIGGPGVRARITLPLVSG